MNVLRRLLAIGLVAVVVLTMVAGAIGLTMDADQTATRVAVYEKSPAEVWNAINRFDLQPSWRSDIDSVEIESSAPLRFVEEGDHGPLPLEVREKDDEELRLVVETYDLALPFTATWIYEVATTEEGTVLTLTERSHTGNPLTRFGSRIFSEPTDGPDRFLVDLGAHFGEKTTPTDP